MAGERFWSSCRNSGMRIRRHAPLTPEIYLSQNRGLKQHVKSCPTCACTTNLLMLPYRARYIESEIIAGEISRSMSGSPNTNNFIRTLRPLPAIAATAGRAPLTNSIANATMLACSMSNTTISPDMGISATAIRQWSSSASHPAKRLRSAFPSNLFTQSVSVEPCVLI